MGSRENAAPKTLVLSAEALVSLKTEHAAAVAAIDAARSKVGTIKASIMDDVNHSLRNIDATFVIQTLCDKLGIADLASPQGARLAEVLADVRTSVKDGANVWVSETLKARKSDVDTSELTARRDSIAARFTAMHSLLDSAGIDVSAIEPLKAARSVNTDSTPRTSSTRGVKSFTMRYAIDGNELAQSQQSLSSLAWYGYAKAGVGALKALLSTNGITDVNTDWSVTTPGGKVLSAKRTDLTPAEAEIVSALDTENPVASPMAEGSPMA